MTVSENIPDTAMVLAAGLGTRMRPLTDTTPKPLIKAAGKPLIDYALDRFEAAGVKRTVINVHHLADQIEQHIASRKSPNVIISDERHVLLETGGGLKKALEHFSNRPIFCTNTDAILLDNAGSEACANLAAAWNSETMDALLLLVPSAQTSGYDGRGDFGMDSDGRLIVRSGDTAPYVFTGLQIISPALIEKGPEGPFSTKILWDYAIDRSRLFGMVHQGFWMHVGDPDGLELAEQRLSGVKG